ncbi:transposase [Yoonia sp. MH D7]
MTILGLHIAEKTALTEAKVNKANLSNKANLTRQFQTLLAVIPLSAPAIEALAHPMDCFKYVRDFIVWLDLAPRQHSSGGTARLGPIAKIGHADIRRGVITGAMTRLNWLAGFDPPRLVAGTTVRAKPRMLVAITLANKMARPIMSHDCKE